MVWPDSSVASEITRLDSEITSPVLSQAKPSMTRVTPVKNSSLHYPPFVHSAYIRHRYKACTYTPNPEICTEVNLTIW